MYWLRQVPPYAGLPRRVASSNRLADMGGGPNRPPGTAAPSGSSPAGTAQRPGVHDTPAAAVVSSSVTADGSSDGRSGGAALAAMPSQTVSSAASAAEQKQSAAASAEAQLPVPDR